MIASFVFAFFLTAGMIFAIGAQNIFVIRSALKLEHVGAVIFSCVFTDFLLFTIFVYGIELLKQYLPEVKLYLLFFSMIFLLYYSFVLFKAARVRMAVSFDEGATLEDKKLSLFQAMGYASALALFNPHCWVDMIVISSNSTRFSDYLWYYVLGASSASMVWFSLLVIISIFLRPLFKKNVAWVILDYFSAFLLLLFAVSVGYILLNEYIPL